MSFSDISKLPIQDRYDFVREDLTFADLSLQISRIADTDALLDELIAKGDSHEDVQDERIPYWAELWPSAIGMGQYLAKHPELVKDKSVLEVGCGLGLAGMVAHGVGGKVILSDYLPAALELAEYNWNQNFEEEAQLLQLDWREAKPEQAADVVLAADVAYEERAFEPLLKAFPILVKKGGKLIISEPNRAIARKFLKSLEGIGFEVEKELLHVDYRDMITKVNVYLLTNL